MPKPFLLGVEVEEIALGNLMRRIGVMPGVVRIHWDFKAALGKHSKADKPNGVHKPRKVYETTGEDALLELMHGKPPMTPSQMADGFKAIGRSPKSTSSLLHQLKKTGQVQRAENGAWKLSSKARDKLRHRKAR
jgi:hypothetical protein